MADGYADRVVLVAQRVGGPAVAIDELKSFSIESSKEAKPIKTLTRDNRVRGHVEGMEEVSGSLAVAIVDVPERLAEFPWRTVYAAGERVQLFAKYLPSGERIQVVDARITGLTDSNEADGEPTLEMTFVGRYTQVLT